MSPEVCSNVPASSHSLDIIFPRSECVVTDQSFLLCFCIAFDTTVTETTEDAKKFDLIVDGDVTACHFKLMPKKPKYWKGETVCADGKIYLRHMFANDNEMLHKDVNKNTFGHFTGTDILMTAFAMNWPSCASEWRFRRRPNGTPSEQIITTICKSGCHVVPLESVQSGDDVVCHFGDVVDNETEWALSFAVAEKELCRHLTTYQRRCFLLCRCISDETIMFHKVPYVLLLHILFYACENIPRSDWNTKPGECVLILLTHLLQAYKNGYYPHYFMAKNNLLQNIAQHVSSNVATRLTQMMSNPVLVIYQALDNYNITISHAQPFIQDVCFEVAKNVVNATSTSNTETIARDSFRIIMCRFIRDMAANQRKAMAGKALWLFCFSNDRQIDTRGAPDSECISILNHLNENIKWYLCVYLDIRTETSYTRKVFERIPNVPIADVFGPTAPNQILDTCIPEGAAIPFGDLIFPIDLIDILKEVGRYRALIDALKFYLNEYISTLEGDELSLPVANSSYLRYGITTILTNLHNIHIGLFNACFYSFVPDEYRDVFPHFEKVVKALNSEFFYGNLKVVKRSLGISIGDH